jgi:hypothetical protein
MVAQDLSGQSLVSGENHTSRITPRVGNGDQLKKAHDVLIVEWSVMKLLEQIENNIGLELDDRVSDKLEV